MKPSRTMSAAVLSLAFVTACGARISLGELGAAGGGDEDGGEAPLDGGAPPADAANVDAGMGDAGAVLDGGGAQDGGTVYRPCGEKKCGEQCQMCPPWEVGCIETAVVKMCNENGKCSPVFPTCPR